MFRSATSTPPWIRLLGALLAGLLLSASPIAAQAPASPPRKEAPPVRLDSFVDKVWVVVAATGVTPGALYVFLSTNVLVISSEGNRPALGTWAESADGLVMTEEGRSYKVAVLELNADRFRIRIDNPGTPTEITFAPAGHRPGGGDPAPGVVSPLATSYRCGADIYRVAFEGGKAYITLPDSRLIVMNEVTVKDAPASRRTFTDGTLTVVEDTSEAHTRVLMAARPGLRPRPCTSLR